MNILIIDGDDMIRRNLPLGFRKYFPEALVVTAHNMKSAEYELKNNIFDIVLLDTKMKDSTGNVSRHVHVIHIIWTILKSLSKDAEIVMLTKKEVITNYAPSWNVTKGLNKKEIFISPMAVNQITPALTVEPMSYHASF